MKTIHELEAAVRLCPFQLPGIVKKESIKK